MYIYVPTQKLEKAPILVAIHYCNGNAQAYFTFNDNKYATLADSKGYIIIYPSAPSSVFATGTGSGAMMANVLAGAFPDIFKAVTAYCGVPDGCFYVSTATAGMTTPGWNNDCANGKVSKTSQAWGDQVRSYFPGYNGSYPKVMIWHGTADNVLGYPNYAEALKQWSYIHNVTFTKTVTNTPDSGYTKSIYGDGTKLIGFSAQGVGHNVPIHESVELEYYGL
ncbi:carbohydrate esterase family 1 protein [Amniculicola lignicola CBS 123094]|uniref:Carbohydrate esterase family 1 protein n=1 Tax=Amniculicola lignicola CBS 123094 TaxID=1392246 RepID=A0A6A5VW44_9PLEO|nr:carbohydrate esterase family 1 protein [Amniculicola lignicola CBS 123094]